MSTSPELATHDDLSVRREEAGAPVPDPHGGMPETVAVQRFARAGSPLAQRRPASASNQALVLRRAQRSYGNQVAQALVQRSSKPVAVQRSCGCNTCSDCTQAAGVEEKAFVQRQAASTTGGAEAVIPTIPTSSEGRPLDSHTRQLMEEQTGRDLGDVRIHTGRVASESAEALHADAYTVGKDIYFAEGRYQPESAEGGRLLVHELTHVEQQAEGKAPIEASASREGEVVVGSPNDPLEREAEAQADAFARHDRVGNPVTPDSSGAVRRAGWTSLTDNPVTNTIASGVRKGADFILAQIERFAPGAVRFFRNIRDYLKNALTKGVDGLFGGILASLKEKGLAGTIESMVGSFASGALRAVGGFVTGQCAAIGELAQYLLDLTTKLGGAVLDDAKKGFDAIRKALEDLWGEYAAPAIDWVKKKLKAVWKDIEDTAKRIWDLLEPLRSKVSALWNEVTDFLAESRRSFNEWLDWFLPKAIEAWEDIKATLKPHMEKVKTVAKVVGVVVLLLSPLGPFVIAGAVIYGLYVGVKALWDKWGKKWTQSVRQWWVDEGLPYVQGKLKEFHVKVEWLKAAVLSGLQQAYDAVMGLLGALGVLTFLDSVKSAIDAVGRKIRPFKDKLDHAVEHWSQKIASLVAAAEPYWRDLKEVFRQSLLVAMFGPWAFLDDGVWSTINKFTRLVMKTPCLRELGGLIRLPSLMDRLGRVRAGIKEGWETIKNPGPLIEKMQAAIAPMIASIEPLVGARVASIAQGYLERQIYIQASILHYLAESLAELATHWWDHLKKIGGDLLWPWPEVAKNFVPMLEDFGGGISSAFDLEFSKATDKFLAGMQKFNGIAGALSGWFLIASVLIGAALGSLGFIAGPAGVATLGAGAAAGLAFAEEVGMGLLAIALGTEVAVIAKAQFDLGFQNPKIADRDARDRADQEDCKAIAQSVVSVITIGALMVLADIAAKFAKFLSNLVEKVPIVRDIAAFLRNAKKKVGDFSLREGRGGPAEVPREGAGGPHDTAADTAAKADEHGIPRETLDAEVAKLREKAGNPDNVRRPADKRFDAEMDAEGHTFDREESSKSWCRQSEEACGLSLGEDLNAKVDAALKEKPVDSTPVETSKPLEKGKAVEEPRPTDDTSGSEPTNKKSAREAAREESLNKLDELKERQRENQAQLDRLDREISEANRNVERLKQKVSDSTGEARAQTLQELRDAKAVLQDEEGAGLLDERRGYYEERNKLTRREDAIVESLKLERPPLRESTKAAVRDAAPKTPDGRFLDANTGKVIEGDIHYGHKYGHEHRRLALEAQRRGMNQAQFNDWVNSHPEWFQIESPESNLSHRFEKPGID